MPAAGKISKEAYARVRRIVHDAVGIDLGDSKVSLVESRLSRRVRELGLDGFEALIERIEADPDGDEMVLFLDLISTNVTSFFREREGLDAIAQRHGEAVRRGQRRFRYWSAASSSGQEAYSLAMLLAEAAPIDGADTAILGTDISTRVLGMAQRGRYPASQAASIPAPLRRYVSSSNDGLIEVDARLRARCTFNRLNLIRPPFPMRGPFDAVMCRNVMIYFDQPTRDRLIGELGRMLVPGGLLITGQAESLNGRMPGFRPVAPSIYERV
jgi:chemotaxis protein methyltransferase CheR